MNDRVNKTIKFLTSHIKDPEMVKKKIKDLRRLLFRSYGYDRMKKRI